MKSGTPLGTWAKMVPVVHQLNNGHFGVVSLSVGDAEQSGVATRSVFVAIP